MAASPPARDVGLLAQDGAVVRRAHHQEDQARYAHERVFFASVWLPASAFTAITLFVGFGLDLVLGHNAWYSPGDLWKSFRGAQYLVWGDYAAGLHYVSAPGTAILLAPPAFVAYHLGLVAAFPFPLAHPPAWEVLCPYLAVVGASIVAATNSLARALDIPQRRRIALNWATACFAAPVVVLWGHPEDVVALAITMQGAALAIAGKWRKAGWIFGLAVALQSSGGRQAPPVLPRQGRRSSSS